MKEAKILDIKRLKKELDCPHCKPNRGHNRKHKYSFAKHITRKDKRHRPKDL